MSENQSNNLSRRRFLGLSVGAVVAAGVGCSGESNTSSDSDGQTGTGGTGAGATGSGATGTGPAATGGVGATGGGGGAGLGLVTLVRATDWKTAVQDACLARMPNLTGKKVVIRPNVIEGKPDGTTNPQVIAGVVAAAKQKGASSIVVAEDAFTGSCTEFMQTLGITSAIGSDAAVMDLAGTATTNHKPAGATAWNDANGIDFYDEVYNADYVVNVPRCKTHGMANFSMALKAWFGSVRRPGSLHTGIHKKAAEAHLAKKEDLVVLDATECMISGGPTQSSPPGNGMKPSNVVAVTEDAIAADVTGVAIIRANGGTLAVPWNQPQITRAMELQIPGWLSAKTDFSYSLAGISEADADAIRAKRDA